MHANANSTKIAFDDSILPSGGGETVLADSVAICSGKGMFRNGGMKKVVGNIVSNQPGTIRLDSSHDRGENWVAVSSSIAVTPLDFDFEYLVEHYDDFRVVFTNGGTDQTVWHVNMALSPDRCHSKNGIVFY